METSAAEYDHRICKLQESTRVNTLFNYHDLDFCSNIYGMANCFMVKETDQELVVEGIA